MDLSDEQKTKLRQWVGEGCGLSEVQRRMTAQFGMSLTYMDVRFLLIDLKLELQNKPESTRVAADALNSLNRTDAADVAGPADADDMSAGGSGVSVDIDRVTKPGSIVSGTATFSDGVTASWMLDQFGRLALQAPRPGYQPPAADLQAFQEKLRSALERRGF